MEDIEAKKKAGRPLRHGHNSNRLILRELRTNEHKDEDALSTLETAAEINAEKVARPAEGVVACSVSSQDERTPEGESPGGPVLRAVGPRARRYRKHKKGRHIAG